jgi:hypothetical protein
MSEAWTSDEVLAYVASVGRPMRRNTWLSYVSRGQAPAPDPRLQVGRTPRWRGAEVKRWVAQAPGRGGPGKSRQARRTD